MPFQPSDLTRSRAAPIAVEQRLLSVAGHLAGGIALAVIAALWLSLLTWSVTDPSLTHATSGPTRNLMGAIGAIVSDLMLQTFGLAAIAILIVPMFWAIGLVAVAKRIRRAQLMYYPVAAFLVAGALSALPVAGGWPLHHGFGGILGDTVFALGAKVFGLVNSSRAGLAAGLVSTVLAGLTTMRAIGLGIEQIFEAFQQLRRPAPEAASAPGPAVHAGPFGRYEPHLQGWPAEYGAAQLHHAQPQAGGGASAPVATQMSRALHSARQVAARGADLLQQRAQQWRAGRAQQMPPVPHIASAASSASTANAPSHMHHGANRRPAESAPAMGPHGSSAQSYRGPAQAPQPAQYTPPHPPAYGYRAPMRGPAAQLPQNGSDMPVRDDPFDVTTEEASRAIARRFAPPAATFGGDGQGHPQPNSQHPAQAAATPPPPWHAAGVQMPAAANSRPAARNALFGGLQFRHQGETAHKLPPLTLLKKPVPNKAGPEFTQTVLRGNARLLEDVLADFGVKGEVRDIRPGPVVTLFELEPARGTKSSRVIGLADDIARSMSATAVRVAVVPGRNAIGIELPNVRRETVLLRELLETEAFKSTDAVLPIVLGKSIGGEPIVADLARMPHLLVAGTTGSGKSVGVNTMILSLLYRLTPQECRFLMIDPKMLELSVYNGIPHLLAPVVTDPQKAVSALEWVVGEMEERYKRMSKLSVRNIDVFNNRVRNAKKRGEMIQRTVQTGFDRRTGEAIYEQEQMSLETMPYIVVVIDEFADLMLVAGKEVEASVQRLAQMARAAGIHIIMATQRPSVDVITGTIKANFPTRISFKVTSKIDSRTILTEQGAEQLLGQGDMLFAGGGGQIARVHGAFVADDEVEAITSFLKSQGEPAYVAGITDGPAVAAPADEEQRGHSEEDLYDRAVAIVLRDRKASTSYLQRRLSIGYNRAADLIERMEAEGLISAANNVGKREILAQASGAGAGNAEADAA